MSFWNRRENWRPVRYPMAGFAVVTMLGAQALDLPPVLGGVAIGTTVYLGIGVMEKALRRVLNRRRARYAELEERLPKEQLESFHQES